MTPLRFEQLYEGEWLELEVFLDTIGRQAQPPATLRGDVAGISSAQAAALYRRACEHLALARARSYPAYIVARLERLTARAHQHIYYRREFGLAGNVAAISRRVTSVVWRVANTARPT